MLNLRKLYMKCVAELESIGMDYSDKIINVKVNGRLKATLGRCVFDRRSGYYTIEVAPCMLGDDVEVEAVKDTIIHELIHTCPGCMNHGTEWKRRAQIVNRKLGYNISRLVKSSDLEAQGGEDRKTGIQVCVEMPEMWH